MDNNEKRFFASLYDINSLNDNVAENKLESYSTLKFGDKVKIKNVDDNVYIRNVNVLLNGKKLYDFSGIVENKGEEIFFDQSDIIQIYEDSNSKKY